MSSFTFDPDSDANRGPLIITVTACVQSLAGLAVFLRFLSRRLARTPILWDDYSIILALILGCANGALTYWAVIRIGMGTHLDFLSPDAVPTIQRFLKALFAYDYFYFSSIVFTKYSILLFYWRVFHVPSMKLPLIVVGAVATLWWIGSILTITFQCNPISGFWTREAGIQCLDITLILWGTAITNMAMDVALILIPLPSIWHLKLSLPSKFGLIVVFTLGGFVTGVSILRCFVISEADTTSFDVTWNFSDLAIWSTVEVYASIICACLPSLVPLLRILARQTREKFSQFSSRAQPNLLLIQALFKNPRKELMEAHRFVAPYNILDDNKRHAPVAWDDAVRARVDGIYPASEIALEMPELTRRTDDASRRSPPSRGSNDTPQASQLAPSDEIPFGLELPPDSDAQDKEYGREVRRVRDGLDQIGYDLPTPRLTREMEYSSVASDPEK